MQLAISTFMLAVLLVSACTKRDAANTKAVNVSRQPNEKKQEMKKFISIAEIPTMDFSRAKNFYSTILEIPIEVVTMEGMTMGIFPGDGENPVVQLVSAEGYKPSPDGVVLYLNGGSDLQNVLDRVVANGGKVLLPKTEIAPEMGYYALFSDTEGNKLGLYSGN